MNNFVFEGRLKSVLIGFMIVGLICMGLTWMTDDALHTRFWTNFLHDSLYFTGIGLLAVVIMAAFILSWAGWYTGMKRIWEAFSHFLIVGLVLMGILGLGVVFGFHDLYHWNDAASVAADPILQAKSLFLNKGVYVGGTVITLLFAYFIAKKLRSLSIQEENAGPDDSFQYHHKMRFWSGVFLPIIGYLSVLMLWLWMMSLDAHWYSTLYAWYATASWFVATMALTILVIIYLQTKGYFEHITQEHLHDLGKYMFAFSVFWAYLWFSQYMLIWYSNNGEETGYFLTRRTEYGGLWVMNMIINFVLPFFVLLPNTMKRFKGVLVFVAIVLFFGHWLDYFLMIKPGALHTAHILMAEAAGQEAGAHGGGHAVESLAGFHYPGLLDIGMFIGFLGLFLFVAFTNLAKASLVSKNDPYYEESLHHHVM